MTDLINFDEDAEMPPAWSFSVQNVLLNEYNQQNNHHTLNYDASQTLHQHGVPVNEMLESQARVGAQAAAAVYEAQGQAVVASMQTQQVIAEAERMRGMAMGAAEQVAALQDCLDKTTQHAQQAVLSSQHQTREAQAEAKEASAEARQAAAQGFSALNVLRQEAETAFAQERESFRKELAQAKEHQQLILQKAQADHEQQLAEAQGRAQTDYQSQLANAQA